jgi:signal transduction histidine kinase
VRERLFGAHGDVVPAQGISAWRHDILQALLRASAVLGVVAYLPGMWLMIASGHWTIAVIDTLVYAVVAALALWPGASYRLRARSVSGLVYAFGAILIAHLGLSGSGLLWLGSFTPIVAILLGLHASARAMAVTVATGALLAAAIHQQWIVYAGPPDAHPDGGLAVFVVTFSNMVLLSAAVSLAVGVLLRGLEASHSRLASEIAERTRSDAQRRELEAKLRQSQKLEAVGRLAGGIAHDFNNLLVPILAHADALRARSSGGCGELDDIVTSAERARALVQRMLAFSRRAAVSRTAVPLDRAVHEAARLLRAGMPPLIEIVERIDGRPYVHADQAELLQVLMNLGTNAADAMRAQGGTLTLALAAEDAPPEARLTVTDTGAGMPPEVLEHVFEPFFTTKAVGEGSGLGLATVHGIVTGLGGRVEIASTPGGGTDVIVRLPRVPAPPAVEGPSAAPMPPADAPVPGPPGRALHVLVVDDEPLVRRTCVALLERLGYTAVEAATPAAAVALVREADRPIDVLLTDQAMPGMSGTALVEAVRALRPDLPVVLATGLLDDDVRARALAAGVGCFVAKPYRAADLDGAIRAVTRAF